MGAKENKEVREKMCEGGKIKEKRRET